MTAPPRRPWPSAAFARVGAVLALALGATGAQGRITGFPDDLVATPPKPRCSGADAYTWYATVQHCMDLGAYGNNCQKLNDTLFALVYYEGDVVAPTNNLTRSVETVKGKLDQYPDGFRIVQAQNCHKIASHPDDNILPPGGPCKGNFSGLWWDAGVSALKRDNAGFFAAYKAAGGKPIDSIVLDPEIGLDAWGLFLNECTNPTQNACCLAKLDAIQNDKRFAPTLADLEKLGFSVKDKSKPHWFHDALIPYSGPDGGYTVNLAVWEGYSNTLTSKYYNEAVTQPVQQAYPNADVNNYGSMTTDNKHCLPDVSGYTPCKIAGGALSAIVGTQQAPCDYVWMVNASVAKGLSRVNLTAPGTPFELTGFNGLLMGVNMMRMNVLSSSFPVKPWVAYKNDTNMSPFQWLKPLANTDFYQEHILHLAMHNPQGMLYFNPCWAKGYCDVSWDDNLLYANLFHELTEVAGCAWKSRKWVQAEFAPFNDTVVASGLELPGGTTLWRVTAIDGKTSTHVKVAGGSVTVDVPGSVSGPIVFKGGKSLGPGPNAPAGVWIEAPTTAGAPVSDE